jgi:hypothetical protein
MKDQKGFAHLEALLIGLAVLMIAGTGWYVWRANQQANEQLSNTSSTSLATPSKKINNFDDCKKAAGSKIEQTYPEVCVTKDGKRFVNFVKKTTTPMSAPAPASSLSSADNRVEVSLPAETSVESNTDGEKDKTCGLAPSVQAPGVCITFVSVKIKTKTGYGIKFFKSSETSENWRKKAFGQCVSSQAKTLHGGYAQLICKLSTGYDYTISNGIYIIYFVGDDSQDFVKIVDSTKFLD